VLIPKYIAPCTIEELKVLIFFNALEHAEVVTIPLYLPLLRNMTDAVSKPLQSAPSTLNLRSINKGELVISVMERVVNVKMVIAKW
jgi:hypothetical protein